MEIVTERNMDQKIYDYIVNNKDFAQVLSSDDSWEVFYHLNEMRTSLFNWYDFGNNANLLEVGGGFGALTGVFCDKCKNVVTIEKSAMRAEAIRMRHSDKSNLKVICENVLEWNCTQKFDYIIIVGLLETLGEGSKDYSVYSKILSHLSSFLSAAGKIVLAVENRFGLRYFCGAVDKHTGELFGGINNYPRGSAGISFDKQQIKDIIEKAGFTNIKFFYPLPDYVLPQLVYSEEYLPISSIKERVIPYYLNKDYLMAHENDLYDDIVRNKVFEFFSNSFLIECGMQNNMCDVVYAALTTDRGEENGFATVIRKNDSVQKIALHEKGRGSLERIYNNIFELSQRGIDCVEHKLVGNVLEMPFFQEKTLCDELRSIVCHESDRFIEIIDELYQCILNSSEHIDADMNELSADNVDKKDFGIILKKAYIDMVPINCFYKNNRFYFFDQEFVRENYPAKYVLYRVLKYTYFFIAEANTYVPLDELKLKYELNNVWQCFEAEERRFVASNRNYDVYQNFIKWSAVNRKEIYKKNAGE